MSSSRAADLAGRYLGLVARLNETRLRAESARNGKHLRDSDLDVVYQGLFLQLVVGYESVIERFVVGLTVRPGGVASAVHGVGGRLAVRSYDHAIAIAAGGGKREYADWLGRQRLRDQADLLLRAGQPFASVGTALWDPIEKARYIRNAIAHPSKSARAKFESHVLGATPLPRLERKPAGYLRGVLAGPPSQTRWELYAANLTIFVATCVK